MKGILKILSLCGIIISLAACSEMPVQPTLVADPGHTWSHYQSRLTALQHWQAKGVVGVVMNHQGQSAHVIWQQTGDHFNIELYGPLGLGAEHIEGQPGEVKLVAHDGTEYQAVNAEALMQETLGWSLPVEGLVYWIKGEPAPGHAETHVLNAYGTLASLHQAGWDIQYAEYQQIQNTVLPTRIQLQRGALRATVVVQAWAI